ncbi:amino acid ABC transporter permease [Staphylococcus carnosus]|uniref:Amino acid ABC transporter permease n=1 Tax=Staphylococcus carnosus TaxID=1281 RepID=A0AAJ0NH94_STACA|nr:amino acid ABC transporter permease [Staphylococcus carnosus]ANZ32598.1 amino acid ABC transporter permease [Staphylococcus carnosus]KKB25425.1 amino acid ABC transporter permease [Staphylococcus carnosus]KOR12946.1 amino acid ABC transporter permease [Staphylococcus carnosus]PNZ98149.1 amino acid ABC transporter permease [Staphylococcus carnosus]QPT04893.1 amino acid ABC transporter permease [Staphylococcus carnosus]
MFLKLNAIVLNEQQLHALDAARQAFLPMLGGLIKYSIPITLVTFVLGLIIALFTALMRISTSKILRGIARVYVSIIRGTPMIVQLFIIFYGLPELGRLVTNNPDTQWTLPSVVAAIIGLSLNVGAYASEIIRGGIISIPKGQSEAAYSIGMNYRQTIQRIILPQAIRVSVPALGNTFLSLLKDTSLLGFILVAEMFRKAQEVASTTYEYLTIYILVALLYWVVCFIISVIQSFYESYLERGYRS